MNGKYHESAEAEIVEKILADAESQAKRILENAEHTAERERDKARREAEKIYEELVERAKVEAQKIKSRQLSTGRVEARRKLLEAREKAVASIMNRIEQGLQELRQDRERYGESLRNLALESVAAVGGSEMILVFGAVDKDLVADLENQIREEAKQAVKGCEIEFRFEERDLGGGCIGQSRDGRVIFDNTYPRRLQRKHLEFRNIIAKEIGKIDE